MHGNLIKSWYGLLALWLSLGLQAFGADVSYYGVIKSVIYTQSVGGASAPLASNAYGFNTFVIAATNGAVTGATVRIPSGSTLPLSTNLGAGPLGALVTGNDTTWLFNTNFNSQSALDNAYPSVNNILFPSKYTVAMNTVHDGLQSQELSYASANTPPTPQIANLSAAQDVITTNEFTLNWNSLAGGTFDLVMVNLAVTDTNGATVYASPAPLQPGALDGNATSLTFPSNSLPAGKTLIGTLAVTMAPLLGIKTSYGYGLPGHLRATTFPMTTRALPQPEAAQLAVMPPTTNGVFALQAQVAAGFSHRLQAATNLTAWFTLLTTNPPGGILRYSEPLDAISGRRFYRVVTP